MHNIKYIAPYQNELVLPYNVKYKIGEVVVVIVVVVVVLMIDQSFMSEVAEGMRQPEGEKRGREKRDERREKGEEGREKGEEGRGTRG